MLKISTRISLLYFVATTIIIAVMAFSTYFIYYNQRLQAIDNDLHDFVHFLTTGQEYDNIELDKIFQDLTERRKKSKNKLFFDYNFILVGQDSIVYESDERFNLDEIINGIMEYDESEEKSDYATLTIADRDFRIYEYKMTNEISGKELDIIMVASLEKFKKSLSQIKYILFIISPLLVLIAALIGYLITKRALSPVRHITQTAESITEKNLDERVPVSAAGDELTELAQTLNDMIERLQKAINSQKRFIADASHDFRTPLTIIRLELELLAEKNNLEHETLQSVEKCLREVKMLSDMAENLLLLARADAHQLALDKITTRLDELLLDTISGLNNIANTKNIIFNINISEETVIKADAQLVKRMLTNALDNAIKYAPNQSTIIVELTKNKDEILLKIENEGPNLTEEELSELFSRFKRTDKSRTTKGFGLGLPIIKTITEAHGGYIQFNSQNGTNSLIIHFPL
jgi:heavy metal sensor kinase